MFQPGFVEQYNKQVVLKVLSVHYIVSNCVLLMCSPFFDRMFQPGFVEQDNKQVVLKVLFVHYIVFNSCTVGLFLVFRMFQLGFVEQEDNKQVVLKVLSVHYIVSNCVLFACSPFFDKTFSLALWNKATNKLFSRY